MIRVLTALVLGILLPVAALARPATIVAPIASGDEPVIVTHHHVTARTGRSDYDALTGRIAIRDDETGEVRGHVFFVAYVVRGAQTPRPLAFLWNGGPTAPALLLHTAMFGPRRLEGHGFVDNPDTLLVTSDLVFLDPPGTGFSRPADQASADRFYTTLGDFAVMAEAIRAWRARFAVAGQPLVLVGESYGTWRVGGTADLLTSHGVSVAGAVLISGGIPGALMPYDFSDAMTIPGRTAAALYHRRLSADLLADPAATRRAATRWATEIYRPALSRIATLSPAERDDVARTLARYIGIDAARIDRRTLVVPNRDFLAALSGEGKDPLDVYDMRRSGPQSDPVGDGAAILDYLRGALGYATDLAYTGLENGYMPSPGEPRRSTASRWRYDHVVLTPQMLARMAGGSGPPASQPWLQRAMTRDPGLHVLIAAGLYDSYNSCAGNAAIVAGMASPLAARMTALCYDGGHMMYLGDAVNRRRLAGDAAAFVATRAVAGRPDVADDAAAVPPGRTSGERRR